MTQTKIKGLEYLPKETAQALINGGYRSVKAIAIALPKDLADDIGLSGVKADEIIAKAVSLVAVPPISALKLLEQEQARALGIYCLRLFGPISTRDELLYLLIQLISKIS